MPFIPLAEGDYAHLDATLTDKSWIVACLCAHWCGACRGWRPAFESLSKQYPDIVFLWIDIEDHAELLGELDIENFPSLLIQYGDIVNFFGCIHPESVVVERLLKSQLELSIDDMKRQSQSNDERISWQNEVNMRKLLRSVLAHV